MKKQHGSHENIAFWFKIYTEKLFCIMTMKIYFTSFKSQDEYYFSTVLVFAESCENGEDRELRVQTVCKKEIY